MFHTLAFSVISLFSFTCTIFLIFRLAFGSYLLLSLDFPCLWRQYLRQFVHFEVVPTSIRELFRDCSALLLCSCNMLSLNGWARHCIFHCIWYLKAVENLSFFLSNIFRLRKIKDGSYWTVATWWYWLSIVLREKSKNATKPKLKALHDFGFCFDKLDYVGCLNFYMNNWKMQLN